MAASILIAPRSSGVSSDLAKWLGRLLRLPLEWYVERRSRAELAQLGDDMLKDIGLTRGDVERELARPFWDRVDIDALDEQRRLNSRRCPARQ